MEKIKETLIIFVLVCALCTGFYFFGKSNAEKITIKDTDTLITTKIDTLLVLVNKVAVIHDTVTVIVQDTIHYEYATLDTIIEKDSSSINLSLTYDEYFNKFDVKALFYVRSNEIILKEYIESPVKKSLLYGFFSLGIENKYPVIVLDCGIELKNNYYIGIIGSTKSLFGISIGRRW